MFRRFGDCRLFDYIMREMPGRMKKSGREDLPGMPYKPPGPAGWQITYISKLLIAWVSFGALSTLDQEAARWPRNGPIPPLKWPDSASNSGPERRRSCRPALRSTSPIAHEKFFIAMRRNKEREKAQARAPIRVAPLDLPVTPGCESRDLRSHQPETGKNEAHDHQARRSLS